MSGFRRDVEDAIISICEDILRTRPHRDTWEELEYGVAENLAERSYGNRVMEQLVDLVVNMDADDAEVLPRFEGKDFDANIEEIYDVFTAIIGRNNKEMYEHIDDSGYNRINKLIDTDLGDYIIRELSGRGRGRGGRDDRGGRGRRDSGRYQEEDRGGRRNERSRDDRDRGRGRNDRDDRRDEPRREATRSRSRNSESSNIDRVRETTRFASSGVAAIAAQRRKLEDEAAEAEALERAKQKELVARRQAAEEATKEPVELEKFKVTPPSVQGYDFTKPFPYEDFWMDDKHYQAAVKSKWKPTGTPLEQLPRCYNINTHVMYYVRDVEGNVTQEEIPVNDENRYINHTLYNDPARAEAISARKPVSLRFGKKPVEEGDTLDFLDEPKPAVKGSAGDVVSVSNLNYGSESMEGTSQPPLIDSQTSQVFDCRSQLDGATKDDGTSTILRTYVARLPIMNSTVESAQAVKTLYNCKTLPELADRMKSLEDVIDPGVYKLVGDRVAEAIVDHTNHSFNTEMKAMSFPLHWPDFTAYILRKRDAKWAAEFTHQLARVIPDVLSYSEDIAASGEDIIAEDVKVAEDKVVMLIEHVGILATKFTLDDVGIGSLVDTNNALRVDVKDCETYGKFFNKIEVAYQEFPVSKVFISSNCGRLIQVRRWACVSNTFVLNKVSG